MTTEADARGFAVEAHGLQRYNGKPYVEHLDDVAQVLSRHGFGHDVTLMQAAYLHDVLEDTVVSAALLEAEFGQQVLSLVLAVTDVPGVSRAERKRLMVQRLSRASLRARVLKLSDRVANVRRAVLERPDKLVMYRAERAAFAVLRRDGEADALWQELDAWFGAGDEIAARGRDGAEFSHAFGERQSR